MSRNDARAFDVLRFGRQRGRETVDGAEDHEHHAHEVIGVEMRRNPERVHRETWEIREKSNSQTSLNSL
jgi:hypothetical protein